MTWGEPTWVRVIGAGRLLGWYQHRSSDGPTPHYSEGFPTIHVRHSDDLAMLNGFQPETPRAMRIEIRRMNAWQR